MNANTNWNLLPLICCEGGAGALEPRFVDQARLFFFPLFRAENTQIVSRKRGGFLAQGAGSAFTVLGGVETIEDDIVTFRPLADVGDGHALDIGGGPVWKA